MSFDKHRNTEWDQPDPVRGRIVCMVPEVWRGQRAQRLWWGHARCDPKIEKDVKEPPNNIGEKSEESETDCGFLSSECWQSIRCHWPSQCAGDTPSPGLISPENCHPAVGPAFHKAPGPCVSWSGLPWRNTTDEVAWTTETYCPSLEAGRPRLRCWQSSLESPFLGLQTRPCVFTWISSVRKPMGSLFVSRLPRKDANQMGLGPHLGPILT